MVSTPQQQLFAGSKEREGGAGMKASGSALPQVRGPEAPDVSSPFKCGHSHQGTGAWVSAQVPPSSGTRSQFLVLHP